MQYLLTTVTIQVSPEKTIDDRVTAFNKLYQEVRTFDQFKCPIFIARFLRSLPLDYADFARSYDAELETTKLNDYLSNLQRIQ